MVLKVCTTEYSVLERMRKAYINFPLKKILQIKHIKQNSFVSPQKKSSQRFISSSVSASAHSGSPELLYLVIKLVVYQCLCPCMFISFSLLGSSCSSLVACPTSLLEKVAQPDHPPDKPPLNLPHTWSPNDGLEFGLLGEPSSRQTEYSRRRCHCFDRGSGEGLGGAEGGQGREPYLLLFF